MSLLSAVSVSAASGGTKASALVASPGALALRREYNGVAATIDTLVRLYSADRLARLADPSIKKKFGRDNGRDDGRDNGSNPYET